MTRKLVLVLETVRDGKRSREEYDPRSLLSPGALSRGATRRTLPRICVSNDEEADEWGRIMIERFNETLAPGELPRTFKSSRLERIQGRDDHRLYIDDGSQWPDARTVDPLSVNDVAAVFTAYRALCMHAGGAERSVRKIRLLRRAHKLSREA